MSILYKIKLHGKQEKKSGQEIKLQIVGACEQLNHLQKLKDSVGMTDQESPKQKNKPGKRQFDSDLFTYIVKLEQLVIQKRTQIIKERKRFQGVIQRYLQFNYESLAKYLDMKGISYKVVEEFLDSANPPTSQLDDDDIADWYAYLESRNQPIKKANQGGISAPHPPAQDGPKTQSSNIIRIHKQDLPMQPTQRKYNKKPKFVKEEAKMLSQTTIDTQQRMLQTENSSVFDLGEKQSSKASLDAAENPKQKRKRRTKKEMMEAKQQAQNSRPNADTVNLRNSSANEIMKSQNSYIQPLKNNGLLQSVPLMEQGLYDLKEQVAQDI